VLAPRRIPHLSATILFAALCTALGVAWVYDASFAPTSWITRLAVFAGGLTLSALALRLASDRQASANRRAQRYIQLLCELEHAGLEEEQTFEGAGDLAPDDPWRVAFARVLETLSHNASRFEQAEHHRAGAEVRARRLEAERDQLREILKGIPDPVLAVDSYGQIVLASQSAEKLFDLPPNGERLPTLAQLQKCDELVNLLHETRRRKAALQRTAEISLTDEMGGPQTFRANLRTLNTGQDEPERGGQSIVAVLSNISALKNNQKRNAELVSAVTHEMKTPLSSIRAYVELLVDGDAEDEATREEFFQVIASQADRLQRLIDNWLNLARIEAGVVNVSKTPRSLNELLQEAFNLLLPTAEQKNIRLVAELSPLYLGVLADRDTLLQAALNLMSNSVKYTRSGGTVTIRSRQQDEQVEFEVTDTGVGLSPEDCAKVFEKFYRVKKDRDMAAGTGLGLPLVKHIVEDVHAGRMEVTSELGVGSTFRVILPAVGQLRASGNKFETETKTLIAS
jgi:two-component system phosphate regulon sensor histidine kinase PhoR